ncbi:hypothetical protein LX36DRAFT_223944 [Colletotrichum falcatum]|nr:hypothetical protein LX36DRAFT_223944 [Colletotrichum falcatum]
MLHQQLSKSLGWINTCGHVVSSWLAQYLFFFANSIRSYLHTLHPGSSSGLYIQKKEKKETCSPPASQDKIHVEKSETMV